MRRRIAALLFLPAALYAAGCGASRPRPAKPPAARPVKAAKAKTFPARYVVKVTPAAWQLFSKLRRGPLAPSEVPVEELKAVSELRKIAYWKPAYPETIENDVVGLNRMYLLITEEETSVAQTLDAFGALTDWVEYIEDGGRE